MAKIIYPVVVKLSRPIEYGSELISELHIQEPKAKHFRKLREEDGAAEAGLGMLGDLTGQPPSVIDELSIPDMQLALETMGNLFEPSPRTSTKR